MPDNQEQIESQLCAYVDDALDPKDQAEIERHLEANPPHRRLLEDLKLGRDLLRGLPREAAPAELTESFTGQLERSALLDGMGSPEPDRRMRIHRLPQIAAAAAIVMLASGLGAVVYFAMPGGKPLVATTQGIAPVPHAPPGPGAEPLPGDAAGDSARVFKAMPSEKKLDEAAAPQSDHLAKAAAPEGERESPGFKEADPVKLEAVARDVSNNRQVQELLFGKSADLDAAATQPAPREAVVMVVNSRDPSETRKQLAEYFTTNNIAWAPAPAADPAKIDKLAAGAAGESALGGAAENHGEPAPQTNATLAKPAENAKTDSVASAEGQATNEPHNAAPAQPVIPSAASAVPAPVAPAAPPTAQAAVPARGAGGPIDGQRWAQQGVAAVQNYNGQDQEAAIGGLYVARNVSRRQAAELGKNLNRAGTEQAALFANAFESNHVAQVRDLPSGSPNDSKDLQQHIVSQAAQGNFDRAAAQRLDLGVRLAGKGAADTAGAPATQPQPLVAQSGLALADKAAVQAEAGQLQRQARKMPVAAASEPQEQRELQSQKSAAAHSYAKRSESTPEETPPAYSLAPEQARQKAAAPTTVPANADEAINTPQDELATENSVDLVIVVQNGTREVPVSTLAPAPATQPAEQSLPAK